MYGSGDTSDILQRKIEGILQGMQADIVAAERDHAALEEASQGNAELLPLAQKQAALVEHHKQQVAASTEAAAGLPASGNVLFSWVGPDRYRAVHETLGGLVMDRDQVERAYRDLRRELASALGMRSDSDVRMHYSVVPPFYARHGAPMTTIEQLLTDGGSEGNRAPAGS